MNVRARAICDYAASRYDRLVFCLSGKSTGSHLQGSSALAERTMNLRGFRKQLDHARFSSPIMEIK